MSTGNLINPSKKPYLNVYLNRLNYTSMNGAVLRHTFGGTIGAVNVSNANTIIFSGLAATLQSLSGGTDGQMITIIILVAGGITLTIKNNTSIGDDQKILTQSGSDLVIGYPNVLGYATAVYSSADNAWLLLGQ